MSARGWPLIKAAFQALQMVLQLNEHRWITTVAVLIQFFLYRL